MEDRTNQQTNEEQYQFRTETIKMRPMTKKQSLVKLLHIVAGGCLFGLAAAGVFLVTVDARRSGAQDPISIEVEAESVVESTLEEVQEITTPEPTPEPTPEATPTPSLNPTQEPIAEEQKAMIERVRTSMVDVTGMDGREEWFSASKNSENIASGMIISKTEDRILIMTESHFIGGYDELFVTFKDGFIVQGKLLSATDVSGVGVLEVRKDKIRSTTWNLIQAAEILATNKINTGDSIIAIGRPLGYSDSVAYGELTSTTNTVDVMDGEYKLLVTNIVGSMESSGAIVNTEGKVLGAISREFTDKGAKVVSAIPMSQMTDIIVKLSRQDGIGYAGIQGDSVTDEISNITGLPRGVYVTSVAVDSPALEAGIAVGDVIISFDEQDVRNINQIRSILFKHAVGDKVEVTVLRKGNSRYVSFTFTMTIGEEQ